MGFVRILALYVLGFLPLFGLLAFAEGAVRGDWAFSGHDFIYQMGAYVAYWGGWLVISSVFIAPLLWLPLTWLERRPNSKHAVLVGALFGPVAVFLGALAVQGASALVEGTGFAPGRLLIYPVALLVAGFAFGWAAFALERRQSHRSSPAAA